MRATMERWKIFQQYLDSARRYYYSGEEINSWYAIFLAVEANWAPIPSTKQCKQRKLSSCLWRLTGIHGQMRQMQNEDCIDGAAARVTIEYLTAMIHQVQQKMRSL